MLILIYGILLESEIFWCIYVDFGGSCIIVVEECFSSHNGPVCVEDDYWLIFQKHLHRTQISLHPGFFVVDAIEESPNVGLLLRHNK